MKKNKELIEKVENALVALRAKQVESNETIIDKYINMYEVVLKTLNDKDESELSKVDFIAIKTLGRAYMETSSDYRQDFLYAMSDVEVAIKKFF